MWDERISIDDMEVIEIKNIIEKFEIVDEETFAMEKNFDIASGAPHYPIIFVIDISKTLEGELDNLNKAIYNFVKQINESTTTLSESIDFSIITFNNKVNVRRHFGYIKQEDCDNYKEGMIKDGEIHGKTYMASALFVAWYIAEKRKKMYQEVGIKKYKPPIFVLISDLKNNETTKIGDDYLINKVISLMNQKGNKTNPKLGLLKALFGNISNEYDNWLDGIKLDEPENFGNMIHILFERLISTIAWECEKDDFLEQDEEDDEYVFVPKRAEQVEDSPGVAENIEELNDIFNNFNQIEI